MGGYSQCLYQRALLDECIESGKIYDRVCFLTGQDYPLWSNERIIHELTSHPEQEYIKGMDKTLCTEPKDVWDRIVLYHFFRDLKTPNKFLLRAFRCGSRMVMRVLPFRKKPYIVDHGQVKHVFYSSAYCCLTWACAKHVHEQMHNPVLERYFKYSFAPDELMMPTIVYNSPYAQHAFLHEGGYPGLAELTLLHHIDYGSVIRIWKEEDFDLLMQTGKMFTRKLVSGISNGLMKRIDEARKSGL